LKDAPFETFDASTDEEIEQFWDIIHLIDNNVTHDDYIAKHIKQRVS